MRVLLACSPPAWRIACRKGPESALLDDVLCQRRFVQDRRLEVDLGCRSVMVILPSSRVCRVRRSAAWLLPASRRWQQAPERLGPATLGVVQPDRWAAHGAPLHGRAARAAGRTQRPAATKGSGRDADGS